MTLRFGKRTLCIVMLTVLAALCAAVAIFFFLPTSKTTHIASAEGNNHTHDGWSSLTSSNTSLSSGYYYLTGDLTANISIKSGETVTICLNGHTLTPGSKKKNKVKVVIDVLDGANFTLCDCSGDNSGKVTGADRNKKYGGGGVYVYDGATFTMYGGTITGNSAGYGGGVYVASSTSTFNMEGGVISGNTAKKGNAGGVYINGGTFNMNGGTIKDNTLSKSNYSGTAGYISSGTLNLSGGFVSGDITKSSSATITVSGGYLDSKAYNSITGYIEAGYTAVSSSDSTYAFAIIPTDTSSPVYDGITFSTALAGSGGTLSAGYYYLGSDVTLESGITISSGTVYLNLNGYFLTGTGSSAVITVSGGSLVLCDSSDDDSGLITGGSAYRGAGVNVSNGTFTMNSGNISENTASRDGGAVYVGSGGTFIMNGGTISDNTASYGGAINVNLDATFTMNGGTISDNSATHGGGVYVYGGTATINDGAITGNTTSYNGGGVFVEKSGSLTMNGGSITYNSASNDGGGVCVNNGTFTMNGGSITDNTASHDGPCVNVGSNGAFTMTDGTIDGLYIYRCSASIDGGNVDGQIWNNRGTLSINGGYYSCTYGTNYGSTTVYGGYFSETAYNRFVKDNIAEEFSLVSLAEFLSVNGNQPDSGYSADYPYAVYPNGTYSIDNVTTTYGETYSVTVKSSNSSDVEVLSDEEESVDESVSGSTGDTESDGSSDSDNVSDSVVEDEITYDYVYIIYTYNGTTTNTLPTAAGTYSVTATIISISSEGEINAGTVEFTIVIQGKNLTKEMFTITGTYIYNGEEQNATYTYKDTDNDNAVLTSDDFDVTYSYNTEAGTATVTFTGKNNYADAVTLSYEIEKADYDTSRLTLKNLSVTYNGSAFTLAVSGLPEGVTVTYYYEGTNGTSYSKTTTAPTNAGTYTVTAVFSGDSNHNTISYLAATLTIEKASYNTDDLTVDNLIVTYDEDSHSVVVSGLPDGVDVTLYYEGTYDTVYAKSTVAPTDAGTYFVTAVFSGDDNYNAIDDITATLTIEKATITEEEVEPLNITAKVGDSLEDIELPEGWEWSSSTTFSSSGTYVVYASYSAGDNYETLTTAVTITVTGYSAGDIVGITGITVGCVVFAAFTAVLVIVILKKRKKEDNE